MPTQLLAHPLLTKPEKSLTSLTLSLALFTFPHFSFVFLATNQLPHLMKFSIKQDLATLSVL